MGVATEPRRAPDAGPPSSRRTALVIVVVIVVVGLAVALGLRHLGGSGSDDGKGKGPPIDWKAVGQALGTTLKAEEGGVHTGEFLRTDLHVVNAGVTENPGMELSVEAMFRRIGGGKAMVMGEFTLTTAEVNKVTDRLRQGDVEVTALHKHLQAESPRLWWLHYTADGNAVEIARTVRAAIALTGTPVPQKEKPAPPVGLDTAALDRAIGIKGTNEHGVYQFLVPTVGKVTDTRLHEVIPPGMDTSTRLMFQALRHGQAAINGDFVMTADRVAPVIAALRSHGIALVEVHSHMLYERPRLFYLHYWATGDAVALARGLRTAVDAAHGTHS